MTAAERLRAAAEHLPPGASITVTREAILEALQEQGGGGDLTVAQLAERFGRSKSCVRAWLEQGLLRGYRLRGREWRIPAGALAEFEQAEQEGRRRQTPRRGTGIADLAAWRREVR